MALAADQIADAAVVGVPHTHLGEVPVAFVLPARPGHLDHRAVLDVVRTRLSAFTVPERLVEADTGGVREAVRRAGATAGELDVLIAKGSASCSRRSPSTSSTS